jgi:hypothetical protein
VDESYDISSQGGVTNFWLELLLATQDQMRTLPSDKTTLWTTDITVVVDIMPVTQDIKIVLLSQCSHQYNGRILRLPLQLWNPIFVGQRPQLLKLPIIIQRLRYSFINVYCLVVQPDGEAIEGPWVDVEEVELQRFGLDVIAVAMQVVKEDGVFSEDTERNMK